MTENIKHYTDSVYELQEKLGITTIQIHIMPTDTDCRGKVSYNIEGKIATIFYNEDWIKTASKEEIRKTAFHELRELCLYELGQMAKESYSRKKVNTLIHEIIRRDENTIYKLL